MRGRRPVWSSDSRCTANECAWIGDSDSPISFLPYHLFGDSSAFWFVHRRFPGFRGGGAGVRGGIRYVVRKLARLLDIIVRRDGEDT